MVEIGKDATYQLDYLVVQYGEEIELREGDIIVSVEDYNKVDDTVGLTILRKEVGF